MQKGEIIKGLKFTPAVWPVDLNSAANPGDYVSLKGYNRVMALIMCNDTAGTCVVTALQAQDVAETGAKALGFDYAWKTGGRIKITSPTGIFTAGETITGAGGGEAVVATYGGTNKSVVEYHTQNGTAFVDGELITGGTSGYTANADGVSYDEDIMVKFAVTSDTFTIPDLHNKCYAIELRADELDVENDFDCMSIYLAAASGAGIGAVLYVLGEPMFSGDPMPSAIMD